MIKEIVIISGKGGTGKTSIAASLAYLFKDKVIADCDVDAADLHLLLDNRVISSEDFRGMDKAAVDNDICIKCGKCLELCRFEAINSSFIVEDLSCEGCGVCAHFCPEKAIRMKEHLSGQLMVSDTRCGSLVHAKLGIAEGNSGKLVVLVKKKAREIAEQKGYDLIIIDGSPGIGCPVIATISGAFFVLIVTEPTVSGIHDMKRIYELIQHFKVNSAVCINKASINHDKVIEIEMFCLSKGIPVIANIPYDNEVTHAQIAGKSIVEFSNGKAAEEINEMWKKIQTMIEKT